MGKSFRDLKIWQKSYELVIKIYTVTGEFPKEERYGLTDQLRRASNSVGANIAEAHVRYYFADKCRVLYQARGECEEVRSHLSVGYGLKYIDVELFKFLDKEYEGLGVGINTYVSSLKNLT